jgi:hypothetical protein
MAKRSLSAIIKDLDQHNLSLSSDLDHCTNDDEFLSVLRKYDMLLETSGLGKELENLRWRKPGSSDDLRLNKPSERT